MWCNQWFLFSEQEYIQSCCRQNSLWLNKLLKWKILFSSIWVWVSWASMEWLECAKSPLYLWAKFRLSSSGNTGGENVTAKQGFPDHFCLGRLTSGRIEQAFLREFSWCWASMLPQNQTACILLSRARFHSVKIVQIRSNPGEAHGVTFMQYQRNHNDVVTGIKWWQGWSLGFKLNQ